MVPIKCWVCLANLMSPSWYFLRYVYVHCANGFQLNLTVIRCISFWYKPIGCTLHATCFFLFKNIYSFVFRLTAWQRWDRIRITGVDSGTILRFSFGPVSGVKNFWKTGPSVKRNFWLAKFLTWHHVRMHKVIFYIPNTLIELIIRAQEFVFR